MAPDMSRKTIKIFHDPRSGREVEEQGIVDQKRLLCTEKGTWTLWNNDLDQYDSRSQWMPALQVKVLGTRRVNMSAGDQIRTKNQLSTTTTH